MKRLLMSLFLSIGLIATTQNAIASNLKTRISDDSKTLSIQIDGIKNGRKIHLNKTFDVADRNVLQKEVLTYQTFDSVGLLVPFHEIQELILVILGLPALLISLLIVRYQARKAALITPFLP